VVVDAFLNQAALEVVGQVRQVGQKILAAAVEVQRLVAEEQRLVAEAQRLAKVQLLVAEVQCLEQVLVRILHEELAQVVVRILHEELEQVLKVARVHEKLMKEPVEL
jgi:hypothetical protein